jgi:hypothetical protein
MGHQVVSIRHHAVMTRVLGLFSPSFLIHIPVDALFSMVSIRHHAVMTRVLGLFSPPFLIHTPVDALFTLVSIRHHAVMTRVYRQFKTENLHMRMGTLEWVTLSVIVVFSTGIGIFGGMKIHGLMDNPYWFMPDKMQPIARQINEKRDNPVDAYALMEVSSKSYTWVQHPDVAKGAPTNAPAR